MTFRFRLFLMALLFLLVACSTEDSRCAILADAGRFCLQPTTFVVPFETQQKVEISFDGRRETLIVELEVDPEKMQFAALTPFGRKLIQASYDNNSIRVERMPEGVFEPAALFAMLQMALWPLDAVRDGFDGTVSVQEEKGKRSASVDGNVIAEVSYTGARPPFDAIRFFLPSTRIGVEITTLDNMNNK